MGLIYKAVSEDAFLTEIEATATRLSEMPTYALGLTKSAFHKGMNSDLDEQLDLELDYQFRAAESQDYAEGVASFLEKRAPKFIGK